MRALVASPALADQRLLLERAGEYLAWIRTLAAAGGRGVEAREAFAAQHPRSGLLEAVHKSAVDAGRTDGATWGSQLAELRPGADAFIELTRAKSILGRMTGFRRVPFKVKVPRQTSGALVQWASQGAPVVVGSLSLDNVTLEQSKVAGIAVVSKELARFSAPEAGQLINADLIKATAEFVDRAFLDPTVAAVGDAPASITYGVTPITATGTTPEALRADLGALIADMIDRGSNLESLHLAMSKTMAANIGLMGESWTDTLGPNGGTLLGIPVLTTTADQGEGNSPLTERITAVDAAKILLADDGIEISVSESATLQMVTAPDSPATATTVQVSLWQENLVAAKIVRMIRWEPAGSGASGYISGAAYRG